jgi:dipeptidyl aminopeptidase/acylaminoacyl peptidase
MRSIYAGLCGLLLAASMPVLGAPVEAYGDLPSLRHVAISPDGTKLAFETLVGGGRTLVIYSLEERKVISGGSLDDAKLRDIVWADNVHVLSSISQTRKIYELSGGRREWLLGNSLNAKTGKVIPFTPGQTDTMNTIADAPLARVIDGRQVAVLKGQQFRNNQGEWMLFAQDLETGRSRFIENKSPNAEDWIVNEKGIAVAESDYREQNKRWSIRLKRERSWEEVFAVEAPLDLPYLVGLSVDDASVIVGMLEDGHVVYRAVDIASGKMAPIEGYGRFNEFIIDSGTSRAIGGVDIGTTHEYVFFNKEDQASWDKVQAYFPNADVEFQSWSADRKKIVVHVSGPLDGDMYRMVDLTSGLVFPIGAVYAGISFDDVAPVQVLTYKAADGLELRAFLTLPKNRSQKNLPLVVLVHGGPAGRDYPGFDWQSQALASRGYAVLQPQFRGSAGWGVSLDTAGYGQFGRKMQTDLSDGVRDLVKQGIVDSKRVCIVGASYGGYAALAGPTLDPGFTTVRFRFRASRISVAS